jgi:hypothetical protein
LNNRFHTFCRRRRFSVNKQINEALSENVVTGNDENIVFNYRLSLARQRVEYTFGISASRFRFFRKPFEIKFDSAGSVVKAGFVLHNYLTNNHVLQSNVDGDIEEMPKNQLLLCTHTNSRSASGAFVVRQKFTDCFSTVGNVPWQADSASRGKY